MENELFLGKYRADSLGRLYVEQERRRWYPIDFDSGRMVVVTDSLIWDRKKEESFNLQNFLPDCLRADHI